MLAGDLMAKPDLRGIRSEIGKLRKFIENKDNDALEKRLAQVAEDALRWATEDTEWAGPIEDVAGMASIIRNDPECSSC
jgi:hypothetical protein